MILREIHTTGFRSFRDGFSIGLEPGATFILGEVEGSDEFTSNSAGKSSICFSVAWGLLGELSTGAKKDHVICRTEDEVSVRLIFDSLTVERTKKRGAAERLRFYHDGHWEDGDLAETQKRLESVLGISARLFHNSVWIDPESKTVQFLFAPPAERMKILEEIVEDDAYASARTRASRKKEELSRHTDNAEQRLLVIEQQRVRQQGLLEALLRTQQSAIEEVERHNQEVRGQRARLKAEIEQKTHEKAAADAVAAVNTKALESSLEGILASIQGLQEIISQKSLLLRGAPPEVGDLCPTCQRPYTKEELKPLWDERTRAEGDVEKLRPSLDGLREKETSIRLQIREAATSKTAALGLQRELSSLVGRLEALHEKDKEAAKQAHDESVQKARKNLGELLKNKEEETAAIQAAVRDIPIYKFWEEGFGSRGIRTLMLDDMRTLLSFHVGEYMARLAGDRFRVDFPVGGSGFEIRLTTPTGVADISTFSRGEVWRANLAVLLALRKTLQHTQTTGLDLLVLDDPFSSLDEAGEASLVSIAQELTREFKMVLMTLPRDLPGIPEDCILRVRKTGNESFLVGA